MASFLRFVSGLTLLVVWLIFGGLVYQEAPPLVVTEAFGVAVLTSIPCAILYAFAQVVADVRDMRDDMGEATSHLAAMREYYEPRDME